MNVPLSSNAAVRPPDAVIPDRFAANVECNAVIATEPEPSIVLPFAIAAVVVNV